MYKLIIFIIFLANVAVVEAKNTNTKDYILPWRLFRNLPLKHKIDYFKELRGVIIEAEIAQVAHFGSNNFVHLLNSLFFNYAEAFDCSGQARCIYAGNISCLAQSNGGRWVCHKPNTCEDNGVLCNAALFGTSECVPRGGYATKNCMAKAKPAAELAESITAEQWKQIEKIDEYCNKPLEFQKIICDKLLKSRIQALRMSVPTRPECSDDRGPAQDIPEIEEELPGNKKCEREDVGFKAKVSNCVQEALDGFKGATVFIQNLVGQSYCWSTFYLTRDEPWCNQARDNQIDQFKSDWVGIDTVLCTANPLDWYRNKRHCANRLKAKADSLEEEAAADFEKYQKDPHLGDKVMQAFKTALDILLQGAGLKSDELGCDQQAKIICNMVGAIAGEVLQAIVTKGVGNSSKMAAEILDIVSSPNTPAGHLLKKGIAEGAKQAGMKAQSLQQIEIFVNAGATTIKEMAEKLRADQDEKSLPKVSAPKESQNNPDKEAKHIPYKQETREETSSLNPPDILKQLPGFKQTQNSTARKKKYYSNDSEGNPQYVEISKTKFSQSAQEMSTTRMRDSFYNDYVFNNALSNDRKPYNVKMNTISVREAFVHTFTYDFKKDNRVYNLSTYLVPDLKGDYSILETETVKGGSSLEKETQSLLKTLRSGVYF